MLYSFKNKQGFTLIEVIISMAVFAVIVTLIFANYRYGDAVQNLEASKQEIHSMLRTAQHQAIVGKGIETCTEGSCEINLPFGYGVYFQYPHGSEILIYADTKNEIGESTSNKMYDVNKDDIVQTLPLKKNITVESCAEDGGVCADAPCACNIFFKSDGGDIYLNGDAGYQGNAEILIESAKTGGTKVVSVGGQTGAIDVIE